MKKGPVAANPDAYAAALTGWRRACVSALRDAVRAAASLEEVVKWGHLVYLGRGPVLLIRAEEERVLFGFWRGKRLRDVEPRLAGGGKYEMATLELRAGDTLAPATARRLVKEAAALDRAQGDPTAVAKKRAAKAAGRTRKARTSRVGEAKSVRTRRATHADTRKPTAGKTRKATSAKASESASAKASNAKGPRRTGAGRKAGRGRT